MLSLDYGRPVCTALYPRLLAEGFEAHHSFIVSYSMDTDTSLGIHDDNSEVMQGQIELKFSGICASCLILSCGLLRSQ